VLIFDPSMPPETITAAIFARYNAASEFGPVRTALLFMPGTYAVSFKVNYYMGVYGLGAAPDQTVIAGTVQACNSGSISNPVQCLNNGGHALDNFWRACENITIAPPVNGTNFWAVSQAAAMRRVIVKGHLHFSEDSGYSSGGFISDSIITGDVAYGTQQQFMSRNIQWGGVSYGGAWNIVKVGCVGGAEHVPPGTLSAAAAAPIAAPKPFLFYDNGEFCIGVPAAAQGQVGPPDFTPAVVIRSAAFRIVVPGADLSGLNSYIAKGGHVVFAPGVYALPAALRVVGGTVLLGLGLATLLAAADGAIACAAAPNAARVGGFLLEATPACQTYLCDWSVPARSRRRAAAPDYSFLYDIYCRVGGAADPAVSPISIPGMMRIGCDATVFDNIWLWVADHGMGIPADVRDCTGDWAALWKSMQCPTCLVVTGNDVVGYGLAAEHATGGDLVTWSGNGGGVFFFQSEYPYHPPDASYAQRAFTVTGAGFRMLGGGAYSFFPCAAANPPAAFAMPADAKANIFTRFLDGQGGIQRVAANCPAGAVNAASAGPVWCYV